MEIIGYLMIFGLLFLIFLGVWRSSSFKEACIVYAVVLVIVLWVGAASLFIGTSKVNEGVEKVECVK